MGGRLAIIGGEARGRVLRIPAGIRPATAALRASLFDILGEGICNARILDLFAGSGSLGLEGLSRGAAFAVFVDKDPRAVSAIRENVAALRYSDRARIVKLDARLVTEGGPYDVVFVDPPYGDLDATRLQELLGRLAGMIQRCSRIVLKHPRGLRLQAKGLAASDVRRYGDTELTFYVPDGN